MPTPGRGSAGTCAGPNAAYGARVCRFASEKSTALAARTRLVLECAGMKPTSLFRPLFLAAVLLGFVTIPEVKVSKDFSYAKVYVSFMFENEIEEGMAVLEKSKGFIRSGLAKRLDTRRCPEIVFVLDESFKREARITELLNKDKGK